LKRKEI
jgi:hypothetical protein